MLKDVNILLGVTGGIAAYKVVDLVSRLVQAGAHVRTIMTENAGRFVGPASFGAITRQTVPWVGMVRRYPRPKTRHRYR